MEKKIPLNPADLQVGRPLPWPVYAADGTLLLQQGQVILNDRQMQALLERGLYRDQQPDEVTPEPPAGSAFDQLDGFKSQVWEALKTLRDGLPGNHAGTLNTVAASLRDYCWKYADPALGTLQLDQQSTYTVIHPIMTALLCELVARHTPLTEPQRQTLTVAAMTANVGMLDMQDMLANQVAPLNAYQKRVIAEHPGKSVQLLQACGITDGECLEIVLQHHEKLDGSGYPGGIKAESISLAARILSLADIYAAMILPRRYRDGIRAQQALREIFTQRGKLVDADLAQAFIREIGVYPPGLFVKLHNGESGIVIRRGVGGATKPVVSCYLSPRGGAYERPHLRNTAEREDYGIKQAVAREATLPYPLPVIWGLTHT
jgi:HD-GYP domain-containing protein (c-di-GMP phosphodiesterase class II)